MSTKNIQKTNIITVNDTETTWTFQKLVENEVVTVGQEQWDAPRSVILSNLSSSINQIVVLLTEEDVTTDVNTTDDGLFLKAGGQYEIRTGAGWKHYRIGVRNFTSGGSGEQLVVTTTDFVNIKKNN